MPYSRLVAPPGDVIAEEPTEVFTVYRNDFPELIQECHELTAVLVHIMVDRARHFTSSYLHDEKLVSLGKLAAGLAHELNNPASALARSSRSLFDGLMDADNAARNLGAAGLDPAQTAILERVRRECLAGDACEVLTPLQLEQREQAIDRWLMKHGVEPEFADALSNTSVTLETLDQLAGSLHGQMLTTGLRWIAAACTAHRLTCEIHEAASRISDLVGAIKGFTEMDRVTTPEPVNLERGLASTFVVLKAKAKSKSVRLTLDIDRDLPPVNGFSGELNQVWANLIDNALDAVSDGGRVDVSAHRQDSVVLVRVVDDGPGIPAAIRDRIFDPFFSTKPVGAGMGLGLDIARRLVVRHSGQIELDSKPGRTEFVITLPVAESR